MKRLIILFSILFALLVFVSNSQAVEVKDRFITVCQEAPEIGKYTGQYCLVTDTVTKERFFIVKIGNMVTVTTAEKSPHLSKGGN